MADVSTPAPTKGVPVDLDKARHLRFPISVLQALEDDSSLERLLYLGLRHEDEGLTQEQVGEIVSLDMLEQLKEPLKQATGGIIDLDSLFRAAGDMTPPQRPEKKGPKAKETETGS